MRSWPFLLALLLASPTLADPIVGRASLIDGDTLEVRGTRIRLHGINDRAGERMFCSEDEAKAAGWRAARG